jgi:hypothetical protein
MTHSRRDAVGFDKKVARNFRVQIFLFGACRCVIHPKHRPFDKMSASLAELSDGAALQPFVAMGKSLKDSAALCGLVKQVISAQSVYVFGEVLALEGVKAVRSSHFDHSYKFRIFFSLFCFGFSFAVSVFPPLLLGSANVTKHICLVFMACVASQFLQFPPPWPQCLVLHIFVRKRFRFKRVKLLSNRVQSTFHKIFNVETFIVAPFTDHSAVLLSDGDWR